MNIIVIGGCHSYSFGLDNKDLGYTFLLSKNNVVDIVAPVTNKSALQFFADNSSEIKKYDIVILQLGNYEYSISFKKIFKKDTNYIKSSIISKDIIDKYRNNYTKSPKRILIYDSVLYYIFKVILSAYEFKFLKENKKIIEKIISLTTQKKTIIIAPFPVKYKYLNLFRKLGQKVFFNICLKEKMSYIDTNELFENKELILLEDGFHLNEKGHLYIYEKLLEFIKNDGNHSKYRSIKSRNN